MLSKIKSRVGDLYRWFVSKGLSMRKKWPHIFVSLFAVCVAFIHIIWPNIRIDSITVSLLIIAAIPWLLPYVKGFEIPGLIKIDLPETKAAIDKVIGDNIIIHPASSELQFTSNPVRVQIDEELPFASLKKIAKVDPNLAIVGFRIEVEKRLRRIADINKLHGGNRSLIQTIRDLQKHEIIPTLRASGLIDLVAISNSAAHGADITQDAANWVMDTGPDILSMLDEYIQD